MNEPTQPAPTEKSQIVIAYNCPQNVLVLRFSSVKKGEKEYMRLCKAWDLSKVRSSGKGGPDLHDIAGDMFISTIDVTCIASVSFVDHSKRNKFIPI